MGRQPRDLDTSEWFHVYNRGHDGQDIFSLGSDQQLFEAMIGEAIEQTDVEVHAYALMTNHFHLLVWAPDRRLSDFVQQLCCRYAAAYNQRTHRSGALFDGRYGSVPVTDDRQLLVEARYVERNPLAFVPAAALAAYRHSSFGCYVGNRAAPAWLSTSMIADGGVPKDYERFVLDDHPSDRLPLGELPALRPLEPTNVFAFVSEMMGADPIQIGGAARNMATAIALELRTATVADLATMLSISDSGVRQSARRGRVSIDTDAAARRAHDRVIAQLRRCA